MGEASIRKKANSIELKETNKKYRLVTPSALTKVLVTHPYPDKNTGKRPKF